MKTRNQKLETRNEKRETTNEKLEKTNQNKQFKKNNIIKEELKEIKRPNWIDKNKFKEVLAIIDSNEFNYKNKRGEFKYVDILKTWLIILKTIQLVKQMLKKLKCIKPNKRSRNNKI